MEVKYFFVVGFIFVIEISGIQSIFFKPKLTPKLQKYNVDPNRITVSGISSGGAMAVQFHFIHSQIIKGAGVFAGGPFACAYDSILEAPACMEFPNLVNTTKLIATTESLAANGSIDALRNLENSKTYIFHGKNDQVVHQGGGRHLETMYKRFKANILSEFDSVANHGQPVDGNGYGGPCASLNILKSFINECGYNGAYEMFNWLYGTVDKNLTRPDRSYVADGQLLHFNQTEFLQPGFTSMAATGLIYVPKNCQNGTVQCKLHIAFHGCMSNEQLVGNGYVTKTHYAEVAELNNIVTLFPQTSITAVNPSGCWDWIGYTGAKVFSTRMGVQIQGVYNMMQHVVSY